MALRQSFGRHFEVTPNDRQLVDELVAGKVVLPPHPTAEIGAPIDWTMDPYGQRNWAAQFQMLRWIDPIRRLAANGDRSFMPLWERIARSWCAAHDPQEGRRHGSYAWADMVDAMRAQTLLFGLPYVDGPNWLLDALGVHGEWLAEPAHLGHSNHALHQHAALLMLGSALGRDDWTQLARERIEAHAQSAFDDEGVNAEAAPGYWLLNYQWMSDLVRRCELEGVDPGAAAARLRATPQSLAHAARPDGRLEVIGDTGPNTHLRGSTDPHLLYVATEGADGRPPESTSAVYRAGFAFGRSGWGETERRMREETFYSLRFGSAKAVHGHHDGGSVTYWAQGAPVLVEAGKYGYMKDEFRDYVLGRLGHNVVHVLGRRYDPAATVELIAHSASDTHEYYRTRDTGYAGVSIDREVVYSRATESLLVVDTVRADTDVEVESRWHIDPSSRATVDRGRVVVTRNGRSTSLVWGGSTPRLEVVRGQTEPMDGWTSPGWGDRVPTTVVKAARRGKRFRTIMGVFPGSDAVRVNVQAVDGNGTAFDVHGFGRSERVVLKDGTATGGNLDADPSRAGTSGPRELDRTTIDLLEDEYAKARTVAARRAAPAKNDVAGIVERLRSGVDYGGAALLRDLHPQDDAAAALVDERTRMRLGHGDVVASASMSPAGVHVYESLPRALDLRSERSVQVVGAGPLALPARVHLAGSPYLVVSLHGALNRLKTGLPRFERMRSLGDLGVNVMAFADPTLDLDPSLSLGWYLGTRNVDLVPVMARMIERVVEQRGIEKVVLLGTSGGGFAALATALYVPGATAVAMSPQTDVRMYHASYSERALRRVFGSGGLRPQDVTRVSLGERYRDAPGRPEIRYVINSGDTHHLRDHAVPFWDRLQAERPDVPLTVERLDLGNGHISPDAATVKDVVTRVLAGPAGASESSTRGRDG
ncbi:heparinase II/III family protein [Isoptericola sp. NPDC057559]|uniref:heparinase II/III domain-containing protein n=1 Tax=Isoptericola sp. NPDC057559 TaxID=3346168 RepID=UPI0036AA4379